MDFVYFRPSQALLIIIFLVAIIPAAFRHVERYGDSSDYVMMGSSLAYDGDLIYSTDDLSRIKRMRPPGTDFPAGMFLIRNESGRFIIGGHSFYYSLIATPFFRLFGIRGFQIVNALLWFFSILLVFRYLNPDLGLMRYCIVLAGMLFCSTYDYIFWQTPATWLLFTSSCFLYFYKRKRSIVAGVFLGLAGASQYPLWFWIFMPCIDSVRRRIKFDEFITIVITAILIGASQLLYFRVVAGTWHVTWLDLGTTSRFLYYPFHFPGEELFNRARHAIVFSRFSRMGNLNPSDIVNALVSPRFGLIWFYPFAVFAAIRMIREHSDWAPVVTSGIILCAFCTAGRLETHQVGLRYLNPVYAAFLFGFRRVRFDTIEKVVLIIVILIGITFALFPGTNSLEGYSQKMTLPSIIHRLVQ